MASGNSLLHLMSTDLKLTPLNQAQSLIYSRTNLRRAYQDFDDSDISGIYLSDDKVVVVRSGQRVVPQTRIQPRSTRHVAVVPDVFHVVVDHVPVNIQ